MLRLGLVLGFVFWLGVLGLGVQGWQQPRRWPAGYHHSRHSHHHHRATTTMAATLGEGQGGQACVTLTHPSGAVAEVYLFGATVTRYCTAAGKELLWMSSEAKFNGEKAIRGGIPLAFPQFGRPDERMAQHGFARNSLWAYDGGDLNEAGDVTATFSLTQEAATHEAWPHAYALSLVVTIGADTMTTDLHVRNTGDEPFEFQCLQHTYLNIGDITSAKVSGFKGASFLDKLAADPNAVVVEDRDEATVAEETDRIFMAPLEDPLVVACANGDIVVSKSAKRTDGGEEAEVAPDTVFWNPWIDKAKVTLHLLRTTPTWSLYPDDPTHNPHPHPNPISNHR
mmetsp:Transcript_10293/g.30782  ORF Transcript_10293/g.30782 Transcript_10293/m.30782 type:complete len:339 (-) Transcript_10293:167-1183(-)